MQDNKQKDKTKLFAVIISIVSIVYLLVLLVIALNYDLQESIIRFGEYKLNKELHHDYWHDYMSVHGRWFIYSLIIVITVNYFLLLGKTGKVINKAFECVKKSIIANKEFIFYFTAILASFCLFLYRYYAADQILVSSRGGAVFPDGIAQSSFYLPKMNGNFFSRTFSGLITINIYAFLGLFGINDCNDKWLFEILGMILLALSATIIEKDIKSIIEKPFNIWIVRMCILIFMINPLMVGIYIFSAMDFALGIITAVIAAHMVLKERWFSGALFAFVATGFYESNVFPALVVAVIYTYVKYLDSPFAKRFLELIRSSVVLLLGGGLFIMLYKAELMFFGVKYDIKNPQILVTKAVETGEQSFIRKYLHFISDMLTSADGHMPAFIVFIVVFVSFMIVIHFLFSRKRRGDIILWILYFTECMMIPLSYKIVTSYPAVERLILSFFFSIGGVLLMSYITVCGEDLYEKHIKVAIAAFLAVSFFMAVSFSADCFISQGIDQKTVRMVNNEIDKYEAETGCEVRVIASLHYHNGKPYYDESLVNRSATCAKSVLVETWSNAAYVNYIGGRKCESREMTEEEYAEYFADREWRELDLSEQLKFVGDTLYWVVYV